MSLALVRGLVDWLPRSATWLGVLAGPLVLLGYLVGSLPFGYLLSKRRLRRQLEDPAARRVRPAAGTDPLDVPGAVATTALTAAATLLASTVAWDVALAAAPNSRFSPSTVGTYSDQVIAAWVSVALWSGLAAVVGSIAPVWSRFAGGTGAVAAAALAFAHAPSIFAVAVAVHLGAVVALQLPARTGVLLASAAAVAFGWLAWVADLPSGWGVVNGPELSLWTTVTAAVVAAGTLRSSPAPAGQ